EPAQIVTVGLLVKEGCLRKVHFAGDIPHPLLVAGSRQDANRRRIAREGSGGESIDLSYDLSHLLASPGAPLLSRRAFYSCAPISLSVIVDGLLEQFVFLLAAGDGAQTWSMPLALLAVLI